MKRGGTVLALVLAIIALFGNRIPIPIPEPGPQPRPDVKSAWLVIVEQSEQRKPETARILSAANWLNSLNARGIKWRVYDVDSAAAAPYRSKAESVGIPAAIVIAGDPPTYLAAEPLPPTTAALDELLTRSTGL